MADEMKSKINTILREFTEQGDHQDGYYIYFTDKDDLRGPYDRVSDALRDVLDINADGMPDASAIAQIEHLAVLYKDQDWYIMMSPREKSNPLHDLDDAKDRAKRAVDEIRGKIRREDYAALIQQFLQTDVSQYD